MGSNPSKQSMSSSSSTSEDTAEFEKYLADYKAKDWNANFIKYCPKGNLTKHQYCKLITKHLEISEAMSEHVFRAIDADRSGVIDYKFLLAIKVLGSGMPKQKLEWAFRIYDVDGNGTIEENEMIEVIKAINAMSDSNNAKTFANNNMALEQRAKIIYKKMDVNNNKKVSLDEFVDYWLGDDEFFNFLSSITKK